MNIHPSTAPDIARVGLAIPVGSIHYGLDGLIIFMLDSVISLDLGYPPMVRISVQTIFLEQHNIIALPRYLSYILVSSCTTRLPISALIAQLMDVGCFTMI